MSNELVNVPLDQVGMMAKAVADSGLFGIKNEAAAFALMCVAQADGIPPIKAAVQYHVIDGKPALKSEAMLARFQAAGGKIRWKERTSARCTLWLSHPQAGELEVTWDMERAKAAGLAGKSQWRAYPAQMMAARCISEGVRALFPASLGCFYTPEEVRDMSVSAPVAPEAPEPRPERPQPQPAPKANPEAPKAARKAVEAEVVRHERKPGDHPDLPGEARAEMAASLPEPEPVKPAKRNDDPVEMKKRFVAWAKDAMRTKDYDAVVDCLGRNGYEALEHVPADPKELRRLTRELRQIPDRPAENMDLGLDNYT